MTPDDRSTRARWMRTIGVFYGCAALLVLGFVTARGVRDGDAARSNNIATIAAAPAGARPAAPAGGDEVTTGSLGAAAGQRGGVPAPTSGVPGSASEPVLGENTYDFSTPDGVPGFGPMRPHDDIEQLRAQATGQPNEENRDPRGSPDLARSASQ
jgi:hypothetical protein